MSLLGYTARWSFYTQARNKSHKNRKICGKKVNDQLTITSYDDAVFPNKYHADEQD